MYNEIHQSNSTFIYLFIFIFIKTKISILKNVTKFHLVQNLQAEGTIISHSYKLLASNL